MEQAKLLFVPRKFVENFVNQIKTIDSLTKTGQQQSYFQEIYKNSFDGKNQTIYSKLAEIGLSDSSKINNIVQWLEKMQSSFQKFDQLVEDNNLGSMDDLSPQSIIDWKFEIFIHQKYMNNKSMTELLESFGLEINNPKKLFQQINKFILETQFQKFKANITPILKELTSIEDIKAERQQRIYRAIYHRNLCFDQIKDSKIQALLENQELLVSLDILYENIEGFSAQTQKPQEAQTYEDFSKRVVQILSKKSSRFDNWNQNKQQDLVKKLHQQSVLLNKNEIINALLASGLRQFDSKQKITDDFLISLYNLNNASLFMDNVSDKKQEKKNEVSSPVKNQQKKDKQAQRPPKSQQIYKAKGQIVSVKKIPQQKQSKAKKIYLSPQQEARRLKYQKQRTQEIQKQLEKIRSQTNKKTCIETVVRQLQLALHEENQNNVRSLSSQLKNLVSKYRLKPHCIPDIEEVQQDCKTFWDRVPKISTIRKKLYVLNLVEIFEGKSVILGDRADKCKDANGILIIGRTGAGKSTLMTALSGNALKFYAETKDYRAANQQISKLIPISNKQESETRYANVINLAATYSTGNNIILIDTPGFEENRGEEMEITNNLATVNLIKTLKSARIIIVLPKQQFYGARQLQNYVKFIKLFSAYFLSVYDIQDAITVVLTKGLTSQDLLKTISEIQSTQTFQKIDWSTNEKQFQEMLKDKLQNLKQCNQIEDPSKHNFTNLMKGVIKQKAKESPGDQITSSPSQSAINCIKETYVYLQKMVRQTFEFGQFQLTQFYLNNLKELEQVHKNGSFQTCKTQLKQLFGKKTKIFENLLEKYLSSCDSIFLRELKDTYDFLLNKQAECIYSLLYSEQKKQKTPKSLCICSIEEIVQKTKKLFDNNEKILDQDRKKVKGSLKIMRQFGFFNQYEDIQTRLQNKIESNAKQFKQILQENVFDEGRWKNAVLSYINQFREEDETSSDKQKYEGILRFVQKYLNQNPLQLEEINRLITCAMTQSLDGQLERVCNHFLGKLEKISSNYIFKQKLEPKIKQIIDRLDNLLSEYEEKRLNTSTINIDDFEKWEIYTENYNEIYDIKKKFSKSQMIDFNSIKKQKSMVTLFFNNLSDNIESLQKQISLLPKNPQNIDPDMIRQKLQTIFKLLKAMEKKKKSLKLQEGNKRVQHLTSTLENSYKKINLIISSIERTCSIEQIRNYQLNLKLMNALTLIQEFKNFVDEGDMKTRLEKLQKNIQTKILSPLESVKKQQFKTQFAFQKFVKVLKYMKKLDVETRNLSNRALAWEFRVDFNQNPDISQIIQNCFEKILRDFSCFQPILQLSLHGAKNSLGSKSQQIQKNICIDKLTYELLQHCVRYIKCFEFIKVITDEFHAELQIVENFMRNQLHQSDLKRIVKQRINTITTQLKKKLQIEDIQLIKKEFIFLNKIHEKTKSSEQMDYYEVEQKIQGLLKNLGKGFETLFADALALYKDVSNNGKGVQYETLRQLFQHQGLNVGDSKDRFKSLLIKIDQQYTNILTTLFIDFDPKGQISQFTDVFLNIFEFIEICKQFDYKYKLEDHLLYSNLNNFFSQLKNGFDNILQDFKNGIPINEQKVRELVRYEKKILLSLRLQYQKFKTEIGIKEHFVEYFEKQRKLIQLNTIGKYISHEKVQIDENYKNIYENTTQRNKDLMKKAAIQRNTKDLQEQKKYIETDHEKLDQFFSYKFGELQKFPPEISEPILKEFLKLDQKKREIEDKNISQVQNAIKEKQPVKILDSLKIAKQIKNKRIRQQAVDGINRYFKEQEKQLDLNNLQNFQKVLTKNIEFAEKPVFKEFSKEEKLVSSSYSHFINEVKSRVQAKNKIWEKDLKQFKTRVLNKIQNQPVKIEDIKLTQSDQKIATKGSDFLRLVTKFETHMKNEAQQLRKIVQNQIEQQNKRMNQHNKQLEGFKLKFMEKQNIVKEQFVEMINKAQLTKQTCNALSEYNKIEGMNKKIMNDEIKDFDRLLKDMKEDLKKKYQQAINWKLQDFINNESVLSNARQNEEDQKALQILNNLKDIFFESSKMEANIIQTIQRNAKRQFQEFQNKVLQDIQSFFRTSVQCDSQRINQYYKLIQKIRKSNSIRFPIDMKIDNKVSLLLIKKFKTNISDIQKFFEDQKVKKYQAFFTKLNNHEKQQKLEINRLQEEFQTKKIQQEQKLKEKLNLDKQTIPQDDEAKDAKIQQLEKSFKTDLESKHNDINENLKKQVKKVKDQTVNKKNQTINQLNEFLQEQFLKSMVIFQRALTYFYCQPEIKRSNYNAKVFFNEVQRKYKKKIFRYLYDLLKKSDSIHAQGLTGEKCFESISQSKWRQLVSGSTFDSLMDKIPQLKTNEVAFKFLLNRYKTLEQIFDKMTEQYKKTTDFTDTKKRMVQETKAIATKLTLTYKNQKPKCTHDRWQLVARICAIWTIQRSQLDQQNNVQFIHKPHPGQILAIFLLLQFDEKAISQNIKKTMIQVSTGQGKSVILGIMSTYLALVGFTVYEACYSTYLSDRDYKDFEDLFELFGVKDKIFYKTFPEICRMMLNESPQKPFAEKVQRLIINPSFWDNFNFSGILPRDRKAESILLIDEVDAFLDENYLGESFFPSINIKKTSAKKLLDFVWSKRQTAASLTPKQIINSNEFNEFCNEISNQQFRKLMQNQTNAMVRDLKSYKEDVYTLIDGKIFYKSGDSLTDKVHYGYRTIFSYYHEHFISKRINSNHLDQQKIINLIVASFSYSKLPSYFSSILGVTGTLTCMSEKQMDILTDRFGVQRTFVQPSIYQDSRRVVKFFKCSENTIIGKIVQNIRQQNLKRRPIVVFFKAKSEVYHFFNSEQFRDFRSSSTIVTHEVKPEDRLFRIDMSTTQGKITLLTVDFGRGTDFKMRVKNIDEHPGLHVICAFLPTSFSDYLQLIGRTGRQGKNGTANVFILQQPEMVDQEISREQAQQLISKKDNDHWNSRIKMLNEKMKKANEEHDESVKLYSSGSSADKIFKKMQKFNEQSEYVALVSRTVIGIDATCSMGTVFEKLIEVITKALPNIDLAIKQSNFPGSFQLKWVIYRNYNSKSEQLLSYSNFENKCSNLVSWLQKIKVSGGWGNQALQVCLQHINSLPNVNQFVIISDAKGNHPDQVIGKRQRYHGKDYFTNNNFPYTTVRDQLTKLRDKKIKGNFYYLNSLTTRQYYEKLSEFLNQDKKYAQQFQIDHRDSTKLFTDFIADKILTNLGELVGGGAAAQNLIQRYKARAT